MYLHSIAAYVDKIVDELDKESLNALRELKTEDDVMILHHSWGMAIRNEFGLWRPDHPLTQHWHEHPEDHDVRDGCDYSNDHPDAVSCEIMRGVWRKVNA